VTQLLQSTFSPKATDEEAGIAIAKKISKK
jgi:hypothetical protein